MSEQAGGQLTKILLVDDDPVSLRIIRRALESAGIYEIRTATDGAKGLMEARLFRPDLIVSDKVMPHMDGLEFCRRVKTDPRLSSTLFVILSGVADPEVRIEGVKHGADDYLVKPLPFDQIKTRVRDLLRQKGPRGAEAGQPAEPGSMAPVNQVLQLLIHLVDLACPGAVNRAGQIAGAAEWMAENLNMPADARRQLHLAAYLEESGKLGLDASLARGNPLQMTELDWEAHRVYAGMAYVVLQHVSVFQQASILVRHLFENWDGSGIPDHLQQAQIPQGSRILRVLVDFFSGLDRSSESESRGALLHRLGNGAGKSYDPEIFASLALYVQQHLDAVLARAQHLVAIEELRPGMRLAADLITASGMLLLRENEVLTDHEIAGILRHDAIDPFVFNVSVYR